VTEIDVALTDFLLCLEAAWFARFVGSPAARSPLVDYLRITFGGFALAALLGGISHGFFNEPDDPLNALLWRLTMIAVGVTASGFALTGMGLLGGRTLRYGRRAVGAAFAVYVLITLVRAEFIVAILFYVPATLICLAGIVVARSRCPGHRIGHGILGLVISLLAPVIQQLQISVHPVYLTHNALYHLVLMPALFLFYRGVKGAVSCEGVTHD
jgi:hypothetical protein